MFKYRIISFPLLLALLAAMVFWKHGNYLFLVLAPVVFGMAVYEAGQLLNICGLPNFSKCAGILAALEILVTAVITFFMKDVGTLAPFFFFLLLFLPAPLFLFSSLFVSDRKTLLLKSAGTLGVLHLIALPLFFTALVYLTGTFHFLFLVLVTKATDTGGYIVGMLTAKLPGGNHKIVPSISPKKSWEGLFGGIALSLFAAWVCCRCSIFPYSIANVFIFAIILSLGSFAGDLTESVFKRAAGVKDSNVIIPGMGGVFDVVDSFIYNGLIFFLLKNVL